MHSVIACQAALEFELAVAQSLPVGAGYGILIAAPGYMDTHRLSAEAKSQSEPVHAEMEAEPGLRVEVDSHGLAAIVGRGLIADVAGHILPAVTRCRHLKAVAFA